MYVGFSVMNIFSVLRVYPGSWYEKAKRAFTPEEIAMVSEAHVVDSKYGYSVCFVLKSGGYSYIPLDQDSPLHTGDSVDLTTAELVTLGKEGEDDIFRVRP